MVKYKDYLESKRIIAAKAGVSVNGNLNHGGLFDFQQHIVKWALDRGRCAVFADCGLGKTFIQLEWCRNLLLSADNVKSCLIIAPLAVSEQTIEEGKKFGITVNNAKSGGQVLPGINIINYESLHKVKPDGIDAIVLDESSILKSFSGVYRRQLIEFASGIRYRLACTATPSPNDLIEIINHADFLNIMSSKEVIACFFTQDGNTTHKWRLKRHAQTKFWEWLASWAIAIRKPSDIGFSDDGFELPKLHLHEVIVEAENNGLMTLFPMEALTLDERRQARKNSVNERVERVADLVNKSSDQWLVWCNLNVESDAIKRAVNDCVEVKGADSAEHKSKSIIGFAHGDVKNLVTKPTIAGFGINWQNCHNMAFVGLSDSFEQFYQATRRCWRFGQEKEVHVYIVISEQEGAVLENIKRKERDSALIMDNIVSHMKDFQIKKTRYEHYQTEVICACGSCI